MSPGVRVNAAWLRLHGFSSKDEVVGSEVAQVVHGDDLKLFQERQGLSDEERKHLFHMRDVKTDGTVIDVELYSSYIRLQGKNATITTVRDITDRKRAEEELKQSYDRLRETQAQLEAEATGVQAKLEAEAKGVEQKAIAYARLDQAGRLLLILEHMPEVLRAGGEAVHEAGQGTLAVY